MFLRIGSTTANNIKIHTSILPSTEYSIRGLDKINLDSVFHDIDHDHPSDHLDELRHGHSIPLTSPLNIS